MRGRKWLGTSLNRIRFWVVLFEKWVGVLNGNFFKVTIVIRKIQCLGLYSDRIGLHLEAPFMVCVLLIKSLTEVGSLSKQTEVGSA